jgi:predicted naringenin-chalcone synthase
MIPSLDAYLINKLKLRQDIVRLPVTEMGCAAGILVSSMPRTSYSLILASVPVIAVESPTATFQLNDFCPILCAAIFGDGAACVFFPHEDDEGPILAKCIIL